MTYIGSMIWTIEFTRQAHKQVKKLSAKLCAALRLLVEDLQRQGPIPGRGWPNYSKIKAQKNADRRHCHLSKGKPTYVCCWEVIDKSTKLIEVYYVGTHEKAPY